MLVLGCETSCDETGLALYSTSEGLLDHILHSQADLHAVYGGVVPELAARDHIRRLIPLFRVLLERTGQHASAIEGVAYTAGPGLAGALMCGALASRSLAFALGRPALGVHHMEAHLLAPMLESRVPAMPFVCLLVSGGHTQLVRVEGVGRYRLLGESIDDAAGEAFDKVAKLLGLGYPGGPALAALAESGNAEAFTLPRPLLDRPGLDFSFSGLKTAVLTYARKPPPGDVDDLLSPAGRWRADLAASFEAAVVDTLMARCRRALRQTQLSRLVIAGGVSANRRLRAAIDALAATDHITAFYSQPEFCTDNGAMIALAGALRLEAGEHSGLGVQIRPRWPLEDLQPPGSGQ